MLEIEQSARIRVGVAHPVAHGQDFTCQRGEFALTAQHFSADAFEASADLRVAGDETGARERLVLPDPGFLEFVIAEGVDPTYQQSRRPVGPQPEIGFVKYTGRGCAGEQGVDALGEARIGFRSGRIVVIIEKDDVEIGAVAELLAAELAVADDA